MRTLAGPGTSCARLGLLLGAVWMVACNDNGLSPRQVPAHIAIAGGDAQSGTVGTALDSALTVYVTDADDQPVRGVLVSFGLTGGSGSLSTTATTTGSDGKAHSRWTLPTTTGTYRAHAKAAGLDSLSYTATAVASAPANLTLVAGDSQAALTGTALDSAIVVRLLDAFGNPAPGESVSFVPLTGGGSVHPTSLLTDSTGSGRVIWSMGATPGFDTLVVGGGASVHLLVGAESHPAPGADSVSAGAGHSCALNAFGLPFCWGVNGNGQVGTGDSATRFLAAQVASAPVSFLAGSNHATCALTSLGSLLTCWGAIPPDLYQTTPLTLTTLTSFGHVSTGEHHLCAVTSAGAGLCWGVNSSGELGTGSPVSSDAPAPVAGGFRFRLVSAGSAHSCGLTTAGRAVCWGDNASGQLGTGDRAPALSPVAVAGRHRFVDLSAGLFHNCALTLAGEAWCWGTNTFGQLGDGTTIDRALPVRVQGGLRFSWLRSGAAHTCGVTIQGVGYCWGWNIDGRLGDGTQVERHTPTPVVLGVPLTQISAGGDHSCARSASGEAYCWGDNRFGAIGTTSTFSRVPLAVDSGPSYTALAGGSEHTCGLTGAGAAWCWGNNLVGELGDSSTTPGLAPVPVAGGLSFTSLTAGTNTTCGLLGSGEAWCWGMASGVDSTVPFAAAPSYSFAQLSAGAGFICGVTTGGQGVCWGTNRDGQLGDSSFTDATAPRVVAGGLSFSSIVAGANHSCGLATTGDAWCWGWGGSLGNDSLQHQPFPVQVSGGHLFTRLFTGVSNDVTCGITAQDVAWCWGVSSDGLMGNGSSAQAFTPVPVSGGYSFSNIGVGLNAACGATTGGQAICWGYNGYGQLGNSADPYNIFLPAPVQGGLSVQSAAAYLTHSCALSTAGRAYCWGRGTTGQLGTTQPVNFLTPFHVVLF